MIISMLTSSLNVQAVDSLVCNDPTQKMQKFPKISLDKITDNLIYIVDMASDGEFQGRLTPKSLGEFLIKNNLPKAIEKIYLMVSDVDPRHSMLSFAYQLAEFLKTHDYDLQIHMITDIQYEVTFAIPPKNKHDNWKIYGMSAKDYTALKKLVGSRDVVLDDLMNSPQKKLLCDTGNICTWFDHKDRIQQCNMQFSLQ